jgi:hypothetical protein
MPDSQRYGIRSTSPGRNFASRQGTFHRTRPGRSGHHPGAAPDNGGMACQTAKKISDDVKKCLANGFEIVYGSIRFSIPKRWGNNDMIC